MRDVQRGLARLHPQPLNIHRDLLARERVERAERLVHHQHDGIVHECTANGHALPHAAGQFVGLLLFESLEPGGLEQVHGDRLVFGAVHAADIDLQHHVRQHVAPVEHDRVLENDADVGLRPVDAFAADGDRSGAVRRQAGDHLENGGLAAAARPHDGDELGLPDVEVYIHAGFDDAALGLIGFADVLQPDVRIHRFSPGMLGDDPPTAAMTVGR